MALPLAPTALLSLERFESLVLGEQAALLRLAYRFTRDAEDARDLLQAALADAFEHREALRDPFAAPAWLRRIVVRRGMAALRRRQLWGRVREFFRGETEEASVSPLPDALVGRAQQLAALQREVALLPPRQATAFTLRYLEGLSLDEVADAMRIDRGTVRIHLYRALKALRGVLEMGGGAS